MSRKTLLVSTGLTPQVVTETLWALSCRGDDAWLPDRLHILTTAEGARRVETTLLDPEDGKIAALAQDYNRPELTALIETCRMHVITAAGEVIEDVDDAGAQAIAANLAMRLIRDLTRDSVSSLHVSLAGGRRSVGVLLALALSLFGRSQDRLSHVLVHDEFVNHPDFFFPPRGRKRILNRNNELVDAALAGVRLVEIPFPRLRSVLPPAAFEIPGFAEVVAAAQERVEPPACVIDLVRGELQLAGHRTRVPPAQLAWAAALAEAPNGLGRINTPRDAVLRNYRPRNNRELNWSDPLEASQVQEWTSRLNKLVGRDFPGILDDVFVSKSEKRPDTVYHLSLPTEKVRIVR